MIDVFDERVRGEAISREASLVKLQDRAAALGGELRIDGGRRIGAEDPVPESLWTMMPRLVRLPGAGAVGGVRDVDIGFDGIAAEAGRLGGADRRCRSPAWSATQM